MGILFALLAAILAATSNLCMRRSIDAGGSSKAYLVVQLTLSFFVMILLNPVRTGDYTWSSSPFFLGVIGGVFLGLLMWGLGKTLEKGPPGLSFAVLNTSSVAPAVIMALLFGAFYGHPYTLWNGLGSVLVVLGLFWAGGTSAQNPHKAIWAIFALFIFGIHALFLVYLQWWAMILKPELPLSFLLPFHHSLRGIQWFMPTILLIGALFQWVIYWVKGQRRPQRVEVLYGFLGGITNGASTFFLVQAPQVAVPWQNAMIFPIFSVAIIILCNIWAQILYKERVNWWANLICMGGLVVGTVG